MAITIFPNYRKPHPGILQESDPILRRKSQAVNHIDEATQKIADQLIQILKEVVNKNFLWLGMAVPQIGYNKRIIVIKRGFKQYMIMINPEIIGQRFFLPTISGCYSLKSLYLTKSHYWFKIRYHDLKGKTNKYICWGGQAVVLQQELNHLEGKLVSD